MSFQFLIVYQSTKKICESFIQLPLLGISSELDPQSDQYNVITVIIIMSWGKMIKRNEVILLCQQCCNSSSVMFSFHSGMLCMGLQLLFMSP